MTIQNLPLAEKTNISSWNFDELITESITKKSFVLNEELLTKNTIVIVDGEIVHQQLTPNIEINTDFDKHRNPENKLIVLNNKENNSSIEITVAKNENIIEPLHLYVIGHKRSLVHKTKLSLNTSANLELTETYISNINANVNIISEVLVGENAQLKINTVSELHSKTYNYHHKHTEVKKNGSVESTNFIINDANIVFEDFTYLQGTAAEAQTKTVSITTQEQKQNMTIRIENIAPKSVGNIINYGITKDTAHLAFNGVGKIQKDAKGCDNQQETRMLNLSKTAEAVANPFLLIDEGDITAGHAASIGQLDEEQIYYLMSRGMSRDAASKLIVAGFLTPFIDSLKDETLRETLANRIEKKLI